MHLARTSPATLAACLVAGCAFNTETAEKADASFIQGWMPASAYVYVHGEHVPDRCRNTVAVLAGCLQYRVEVLHELYKLEQQGVQHQE